MGLPLYYPPVDSDIKAKVPKDPPTRARSTIRRTRRNINDSSSRAASASHYYARRVNLGPRARIVSPPTADSAWTPWDNIEPGEAYAASRSASRRPGVSDPYPLPQDHIRSSDSGRPGRQSDPVLREVITRNGPMSQEVVRYFGEHMARLYAGTSARQSQSPEDTPESDQRGDSSDPVDDDSRPWIIPSDRPTPPSQSSRSTPRLARSSSQLPVTSARAGASQQPRVADVAVLRSQDGRLLVTRRVLRSSESAPREVGTRRPASGDATRESQFDGLGDRDRSLSPEGDGVWDTLLSSITPDPQPPSVGTSFASTSAPASAAASQSTANSANSSSTSLSGGPVADRETPQEFDFEQFFCESGGDNSDTDGDDDDESRENTLRRFGRSYADVVAHSHGEREDDDFEMLVGGVESMQRIVRNLARREDIPDEWWAEAGLSRTLSREAA